MFRFEKLEVLATTLFVLFGHGACVGDDSQPAQEADPVRQLLLERVDVLSQIVELETEAYRLGITPLERVLDSRIELTRARIEVATAADERIVLHEELVDQLRELENVARLMAEAAMTPQVDVLRVRAARLLAEADLARLQAAQE